FELELDGRPVTALLYFDFTYQYYVFSLSFSIIVSLIIFILIFIYSMGKLTKYVCRLSEEVQILEGGNLDYDILETGNDELTNLARSLNQMRSSFKSQLENEQKIHTAYRQFITELSHDLRTPLTSLILYTEILRSNRYENERQLRDYLEKIDSKAQHIKQLSDYLFEYALDRLPSDNGKRILMQAAFSAVMNDVIGDLEVNGFEITKNIEWRQLYVKVNPEYVRRIFENLQSNIRRYAERSADVLVESVFTEKSCGFSFMNTVSSGRPLIKGTGIGITNVRSMMSEMGGTCSVEETDSVFEITIMFPIQ
ncbi:MAG: HAMP domain-containing histidine kinase, partial [Oscillospiraceae bacterium]|nr:HAMP domain-containing histidine kinase [Oscillospiraceae bacterium]